MITQYTTWNGSFRGFWNFTGVTVGVYLIFVDTTFAWTYYRRMDLPKL